MRVTISIAVAMMTLALAGCGPAGKTIGKTTTGQRTYNTQWEKLLPDRVLIDPRGLNDAVVTWTDERMRDNAIVQQRVQYDGGSRIFVEHLSGAFSLYNTGVTDRHNNPSKVLAHLDKYFLAYKIHMEDMEKGRIRKYGDRGGWVGEATAKESGTACVIGRLALLSKTEKNLRTDERYDTIVQIRDCSGKRTMEQVKKFLKNVRIVSRA